MNNNYYKTKRLAPDSVSYAVKCYNVAFCLKVNI